MYGICKRGEITAFLSLMLAAILVLFEATFQSARSAMLRTSVEESLELAEYSVLSEYNRELLDNYALFYLDLSYGGGTEDTDYLNDRLKDFLDNNLTDGVTSGVDTWDFARATDENGTGYYEQAVAYIKDKTGASILDSFKAYVDYAQLSQENSETYDSADAQESQNLEELERRREEEEEESTPDVVSDVYSLKAVSILNLVVENTEKLSGKQADLSNVPSNRTLLAGSGARGINSPSVTNDLLFLSYLMEFFPDAVDYLADDKESTLWLDYQLEYIIAGNDSDIENLETVCNRLLLIREGMNYAYILTDSSKVSECAALAEALVGVTMIPGLVEAVKQVLLLAWAYAESLCDLKVLLGGGKVVFYKNSSTWKLSLESALDLGLESLADSDGDDDGLEYKDYLGILLYASGRSTKTMRSLDAIEGTVNGNADSGTFYIDQCTDAFWVRAVCTNGTEYAAERWFCYEW